MERVFVLLAMCAAVLVNAHVFKTGNCPDVDVMESFDYSKFQGTWYAIEKSNTLSSCMSYNFLTKNEGSKIVEEKYRFFGVRILDLTDFSQTGQLSTPDDTIPAKMLVQFPFSMNPFTPVSFWVMSTDYENYASIWSCRRFLFGHFQSALILSRNQSLDRAIVNKLRSRFEFYGVDKSDLSVVDQSDCPHTPKVTTTVDVTSTSTVSTEKNDQSATGIGSIFGSDVIVTAATPSTTVRTTTTTTKTTTTPSSTLANNVADTTTVNRETNEINTV